MVCAITMVRDDYFFLEKWINHYSQQIGIENLYVILHGGDEVAKKIASKVSVICVPIRSTEDSVGSKKFNGDRFYLINNLANSLIRYFEWVIVTDADEYIVADPIYYETIKHYLETNKTRADVITPIGLNVVHRVSEMKNSLTFDAPIIGQRPHSVFDPLYCKPAISRVPIYRSMGNHASNYRRLFVDDSIYLFHMKFIDYSFSMQMHYFRSLAKDSIPYEAERYPVYKGGDFPLKSGVEERFNKYDRSKLNHSFDFSNQIKQMHRSWRKRFYLMQKDYWRHVISKSPVPYSKHYRFDLTKSDEVYVIPERFHHIV